MIDPRFLEMVEAGALVVVNHSGGKDSMAMFEVIKPLVPPENLVVVHADLGNEVEWAGVKDHIRENIDGLPLEIAEAIYKDGTEKNFLNMVEKRGMWPSKKVRFCTSDLKRGPIEKVVRHISKERDNKLIVDCIGYRREESTDRAKLDVWKYDAKNSKAGRTWIKYSPILELTEAEVWRIIADAGKEPHWAYKKGMKRLSCCFCVLAKESDLRTAAKLAPPELVKKYTDLEERIGHTFKNGKSLAEIIKPKAPERDLFDFNFKEAA